MGRILRKLAVCLLCANSEILIQSPREWHLGVNTHKTFTAKHISCKSSHRTATQNINFIELENRRPQGLLGSNPRPSAGWEW